MSTFELLPVNQLPQPIRWTLYRRFQYGVLKAFSASGQQALHNQFIAALEKGSPRVPQMLFEELMRVWPEETDLIRIARNAGHGNSRPVLLARQQQLAQAKRYLELLSLLLEACAIVAELKDQQAPAAQQASRSPL